MLPINDITRIIVLCAIEVHRALGPGLLESAYRRCLAYLLIQRGLYVEVEKALPIRFQGVSLDCGYRLDLMVDRRVVVEVKSIEALAPIHTAQMMTYLRLSGCRVGLILNFNVRLMKTGIRRIICDPREPESVVP